MGIELGPDGEFEKSVDLIIASSASTREQAEDYRPLKRQRQESMYALMEVLEASNIKGLPPRYIIVGKGKERQVIVTTPFYMEGEYFDYLAFSAEGFFAYRFKYNWTSVMPDDAWNVEETAIYLQDPTTRTVEDDCLKSSKLVDFHNHLRTAKVALCKDSDGAWEKYYLAVEVSSYYYGWASREVIYAKYDTYNCEKVRLTTAQALEEFEIIDAIVKSRYTEAKLKERDFTQGARRLSEEFLNLEEEKPKRIKGLSKDLLTGSILGIY
ncbi:hypothetical protein HYT59_01190 [Candidatus Woesebacteria bacterium]|nr:hypothetical protein [Candidatus Woesebacteria bacterium]